MAVRLGMKMGWLPLLLALMLGYLDGKAQALQWKTYAIGDTIQALEDEGQFIWIATRNLGVARMRKSTGQLVYFGASFDLPSTNARDLALDRNGLLWVATDGGVGVLGGVEPLQFDTTDSALPSEDVRALAIDEARIWMGTAQGLALLSDTGWADLSAWNDALPDRNIRALTAAEDELWVGMQSGGLARLRNNTWTYYADSTSPLAANTVWELYREVDGTVWIGTAQGLQRWQNNQWETFTPDPAGLPTPWVNEVTVDAQGRAWAAHHVGLSWLENGTWTTYREADSPLPGEIGEAVLVDGRGDAWIGMFNGNLALFNPAGIQNPLAGSISATAVPMPFREGTTLLIDNPTNYNGTYSLTLYSSRGQLLRRETGLSGPEIYVPGTGLPAGSVIFLLESERGLVDKGVWIVQAPLLDP